MENNEKHQIKIEVGNWQYNAGIVGLYNILKNFDENSVRLEDNAMYFNSEALENFQDKYFKYLIDSYEKVISWYKIVSFEERMIQLREKIEVEKKELEIKELDEINNYVRDILKKYLKSNSYVAAYELIESDIDLKEKEKELKTISLKKSEKPKEKEEEILDLLKKIEEIIKCVKSESGKKYIAAKNVMYQVIRNGWDGVSILNKQTKEKDMYKDLENYFVIPALEYLKEDKGKYKYNCFVCNNEMKNLNNDFSFLVNTGFDTARKPSHVWDFNNDVAMCPICKLVYSCLPAGFTYLYDSGLFINANTNIGELTRINEKIKSDVYRDEKLRNIYKALNQELQEDQKYELEDIQLVRFEGGKYIFNILSKNMIRVFKDSKSEFSNIMDKKYNINGEAYRLVDEVINRTLNNENLFTLIHKIIYSKIANTSKYLYETDIFSVIKINFRILGGLGYMENRDIQMLSQARTAGRKLKEKYKIKGSEHKLSGICYRLLNGIKTNNIPMVMDTILNCYLYCKEDVPKIIMEMMADEEFFKELGYAFVSGILSIEYKEKDEKGGN